ncbi:uncharacterized protein JCM6883_002252 [Sporobolomyces salmoneus]|uniref:uncharacterized protein n=1 Tax=Sporobolomyces salmoneus TaxID=183962 RepID=UPI0031791691
MAPNRSKSAKPGGLRLPGTFNDSSPAPLRSSSTPPQRTATARAPPLPGTTSRKLPDTTSVPASRLTAKPVARTSEKESLGSGLISSFGTGAGNTTSGRLERARSSSAAEPSRLERLGLNRATARPVAKSPSPEESGSDREEEESPRERSRTPKPSWNRGSSDEEEVRPNLSIRRRRRDSSESLRHAHSPRPVSPISAVSIPPVRTDQKEEEHKLPEEAKGTLLGSLWNKATTAWNGGAATEVPDSEKVSTGSTQTHLKEDPFRKTKRIAEEHEETKSPSTEHNAPSKRSQPPRAQTLPEPESEPVEPITYHRPVPIHPRNILLASAAHKFRHNDPYDWLGDQAKSPLDAYLFHRSATRMATRKVRLKRPPPHGMATAPAILSGAALAGSAATGISEAQAPSSSISNGVFASKEFSGPIQAFSQAVPHPPISAPHPGPPPIPPIPPVPPPIPSSYRPANSFPVSGTSTSTGSSSTAPVTSSQPTRIPNPNALPSFPAPSSLQPQASAAPIASTQLPSSAPVQQRRPIVPVPSTVPAQQSYPYIAPGAPLPAPAPVFTAPATSLPSSNNTEAPLGDMFKTALAKKLFGSQLSDAPPPLPVASSTIGLQYPFAVLQPPLIPQPPQTSNPPLTSQSSAEPSRLPTPAEPNEVPTSVSSTIPPSSSSATSSTPIEHGVLPPMPIPQAITPPPLAKSSISFAPPGPFNGLGGWNALPSTISSLPSPGPHFVTSPSPEPSTPGEHISASTSEPSDSSIEHEDGGEDESKVENGEEEDEDSNLPTYESSAPRPTSPPGLTSPAKDETRETATSYLSLPSLAALTVPLPPSPAPSSIISVPSPIPRQLSTSPVPTLPEKPTSMTEEETDEISPPDSSAKSLPPAPSRSPALPPLPPLHDHPLLVESPALPPLPSVSPDCESTLRALSPTSLGSPASNPPTIPSVALERTPSLAISTESTLSPEANSSLEVASIVLQPPTPIEPNGSILPSEPLPEPTNDTAATTLTPLSLDLELDSSPLSFDFDSLDFSTPSIVPELPDTQSYFSSLGLNFGGGGGKEENDGVVGGVERDDEGRLELPVLREENLLDDVELESEDDGGDDMSDQFDAATSFVSGFREVDLARAKVDPGHTGRTEKWLESQGIRGNSDLESFRIGVEVATEQTVRNDRVEDTSTIFRPRTAPPSSIPPTSIPPSSITRSLPSGLLSLSTSYSAPILPTLREDEDGGPSSPIRTVINFDKPLSALNRGREVSSTHGGNTRNVERMKAEEEEERKKRALKALSNQAFLA